MCKSTFQRDAPFRFGVGQTAPSILNQRHRPSCVRMNLLPLVLSSQQNTKCNNLHVVKCQDNNNITVLSFYLLFRNYIIYYQQSTVFYQINIHFENENVDPTIIKPYFRKENRSLIEIK